MKEIVGWLVKIEGLAAKFYAEVAERLQEDKKTSDFFRFLAEEEEWHFHIMGHAADLLIKGDAPVSFVGLDRATAEKIEDVFLRNRGMLSSRNIGREEIFDCLVTVEFSEWNDIFLYVVNSLKNRDKDFMRAAARIQNHLKEIEKFLESVPEGGKYLHVIRCLPEVWKRNILIVEDFEPVSEFLRELLLYEGTVDVARNGHEGIEKVKESYFDVIISDIDMSLVNGIDFYKEAAEKDPDIGERFLFITGSTSPERIAFLQKNKLRFLVKPAPIKKIREQVHAIIHRAETDS
jgi:CheY-like chemotaxis protein